MKALAPAPSRSTATVTIAWGIITIPLSLYSATEETRVARQERSEAGNPVGRVSVDKVTDERIDPRTVRKVVVTDSGDVELTDDEIAAVTGSPTGVAEIVGLIDAADIGFAYMPVKLYQARPKREKGKPAAADKAFALLMAALAKNDQAAIVKVTIRGAIAHYAALTAEGNLMVLAYADAVRKELPMPEAAISDKEMDMASALLDAIGPVSGELRDETSQKIGEYVATKASAGGERPTVATPVEPVGVDDLMASLEASVAAAKAS